MKHLLVAYAVTLAGVWTMHADGPALEEGFVSLFGSRIDRMGRQPTGGTMWRTDLYVTEKGGN